MYGSFKDHLCKELQGIRDAGLFKEEVEITSAQGAHVAVEGGGDLLNLCANNYLGLAQHPEVNAAAMQGLRDWGYGMASVRFICGTQRLHKDLEDALARFLCHGGLHSLPLGF
jgi:glycine C-acetyltransferase